jgi:hypothetical protein
MGLFVVRSAQRAHSKLQKAAHRTGARCGVVAAATDETSEGAKCGHHAAVQLEPPGQRSGGFLSACEGS